MSDVTKTGDMVWEDNQPAADGLLVPSCIRGCQSRFRAGTATCCKWTGTGGELTEEIWTHSGVTGPAASAVTLTSSDQRLNQFNHFKMENGHLVRLEVFSGCSRLQTRMDSINIWKHPLLSTQLLTHFSGVCKMSTKKQWLLHKHTSK